jgi:hypothetical protein
MDHIFKRIENGKLNNIREEMKGTDTKHNF